MNGLNEVVALEQSHFDRPMNAFETSAFLDDVAEATRGEVDDAALDGAYNAQAQQIVAHAATQPVGTVLDLSSFQDHEPCIVYVIHRLERDHNRSLLRQVNGYKVIAGYDMVLSANALMARAKDQLRAVEMMLNPCTPSNQIKPRWLTETPIRPVKRDRAAERAQTCEER